MNLLSFKSLPSSLSSRYEHNIVGYYMWSVDYNKFLQCMLNKSYVNFLLLCCCFEIGSHCAALAFVDPAIWARLVLKSQRSICLFLLNSWIANMSHITVDLVLLLDNIVFERLNILLFMELIVPWDGVTLTVDQVVI